MHEDQKLRDASDFLDEMIAAQNNPTLFHRKLRAFLSSARSVLQYADKETRASRAGGKWYKNAVSKRVIQLMRKQRNTDVHHKPVTPDKDAAVEMGAGLSMTSQLGMVHTNAHYKILGKHASTSAAPIAIAQRPSVSAKYTYFFAGKRAEGNVISLSKAYLTELQKIVADGRAKGFLTK